MKLFTSPLLLLGLVVFTLPAVAGDQPQMIGAKIYEGGEDLSSLTAEWHRLGIDTGFLSVDVAESGELIPALQAEGLLTFIITPIFFNPEYLEEHPEAYAISGRGLPAHDDWVHFVCPSREDYRRKRADFVLDLLRSHRPDGLSLDFIRHFVFWEMVGPEAKIDPLDTTCFCDHCLARFQEDAGLRIPGEALDRTESAAGWILENHATAWQEWRADLITSWVRDLTTRAKVIDPEVLINLHLVPWGRHDYDNGMMRVAGQDLEALGEIADLVSPMTYAHMLHREPEWVASVTRELAERVTVPVIPSIQVRESYLETELEDEAFARSLAAALEPPSAGVVLWSWPHLEKEPEKQAILASLRTTDDPGPPGVFFDDFTYDSPAAMTDNGWVARTAQGIPGIPGARWGTEGVSFVADLDRPKNRLMRLTSGTAGDAASTNQIQLCHQRKYLDGTYAARVRFEDEPISGPDGDVIVETFYIITPASESEFSETDFEYLPNGGWGVDGPTLWNTSWAPWGRVRPKPADAEHDQDNTSTQKAGTFAGWHTLVIQVDRDSVSYFLDGELAATHGDGYAPTAPMSINFNLWFDEDGVIESREHRQYVEHVDWVFHQENILVSPAAIDAQVDEYRREDLQFLDTVPEWDPAQPSLCDL